MLADRLIRFRFAGESDGKEESYRVASPARVTQPLVDWSKEDRSALEALTPLVYEELRRLAHHYMNRERAGHSLQTTALVNEAYLSRNRDAGWKIAKA